MKTIDIIMIMWNAYRFNLIIIITIAISLYFYKMNFNYWQNKQMKYLRNMKEYQL